LILISFVFVFDFVFVFFFILCSYSFPKTPSSLLPQHITAFSMTSLSLKIHADLLALGPATHLLLTILFY